MGAKAKSVGFLILLYGAIAFLVNFGIWHPPLVGGVHVLWNPLDALFTGRIVGDIPLVSGGFAFVLNYLFALIHSGVMGVLGFVFLLH